MQSKAVKQPYMVPWLVEIIDILDESKTVFSLLVSLSIAKMGGAGEEVYKFKIFQLHQMLLKRTQSFRQPDFMK